MRVRVTAVTLGLISGPASAQFVPPTPAQSPQPGQTASPVVTPSNPAGSPRPAFFQTPPVGPSPLVKPSAFVPAQPVQGTPDQEPPTPQVDPTVKLPQPENLLPIDPNTVSLRRGVGTWELWAGRVLLRDFGPNDRDGDEAVRVFRNMRPTDWGRIGSPRVVVEYGLSGGVPPKWLPPARVAIPVDRKTVRAEAVRGAWVVRDDANILLNFGPTRADAEQAVAVVKRYGFNRLGQIGTPAAGLTYLYSVAAGPDAAPPEKANPAAALIRAAQEQSLTRTGVEVPGVGYVGEKIAIDPLKLDVKKAQNEWVLVSGTDVLGRFGYSELTARDALRVVKDGRFTDFCRVGNPGVTFFLVNGQPPKKVPYQCQGVTFDAADIRVRDTGAGAWVVADATGRTIVPAAGREDAELIAGVLRAYKFDQSCRVGSSPKASLMFFAKTATR